MADRTDSPSHLKEKGLKAFYNQDYNAALEFFNAAYSSSSTSGDTLAAAEIANNLSLCYLKSGDSQKAFDIIQNTDQFFKDAGDKKKQAITLANQAAALEGLHKFDLAAAKYEDSSSLFKEIGCQDERALVQKSLSQLHLRRGHQLEAMAAMQIAIDNQKHPSIVERFLRKLLKIPFGL